MPRSASSVGSSSRYNPYSREGRSTEERQYQQQSEALHNASDLSRIRAIDDEIERLYQARDVIVERVGPLDLIQFLSNSEAEDFDGDGRRTRPTWTMLRQLIRQKKDALKKVRTLLEKYESLERSTSMLITMNCVNTVERCLEEKEKVQRDLRLAQSEIRMLRFATMLDEMSGEQSITEKQEEDAISP
ncbi:hypothetical protein FPOAC2_08770 [Fusarium poae]|uniref:Up-regulated during septation protein 1 domain-containing protein n=1 Tax=Fusarium poae TaxID=36050 RepID=A0A1B8AMW0_FUSPO|nr:hypothetical protein FPOAC1_008836 [Fusarium poae]KAG8669441.1 hypothetical protein FPOAC1_008836 [Fusarium poae]OBS21666.1 hypothetical protein FPOA_08002 [Fusarium poae]